MKISSYPLFIILIGAHILFGCRNPNEPIPLHAPGISTPIVYQMTYTVENGQIIGKLGLDKSTDNLGSDLTNAQLNNIRPNPFSIHCEFPFKLKKSGKCSIWLTRALFYLEYIDEIPSIGNATTFSPYGSIVKILCNQSMLLEGKHNFVIDCRDFQPGFYRVYLQFENEYYWTDILYDPDKNLRTKYFNIKIIR